MEAGAPTTGPAAKLPTWKPQEPFTVAELAAVNEYGRCEHALMFLARQTDLADYDDEIATSVERALFIVRGVMTMAGKPTRPDSIEPC